jgi:UDP-glucose 4-epimerase
LHVLSAMNSERSSLSAVQSPTAGFAASFEGAEILITGGLGLIGSTLAHRLVTLGAKVHLLDVLDANSGANRANIATIADRVTVTIGDVRDFDLMRRLIPAHRILFNLAAQTSHMGSMQAPLEDFDVNARAQLGILEACRAHNPDIRIVFASTRQIYGRPDYLPVDEKHPLRPADVNGVSKMAAEALHTLYHQVYGLRTTSLRLTNIYGPRMRIKDARQTFIGVWLLAAIEGRSFEVWGGDQIRDFCYVDDAADALLAAAAVPAAAGKVYNVGGGGPLTLNELATAVVAANQGGSYVVKEFPADRQRIDIGSYYTDDTAFRNAVKWGHRMPLLEGLDKSLQFFRKHFRDYV